MSIVFLRNLRGRVQLEAFDAAYLDALRSADPETERHFVAYFSKLIYIKLRSGHRSRQLVDDVCQETFLRVFRIVRSAEGVRFPERLGALVNSVCNNVLLESLRACDRCPAGAEPREDPAPVDADPEKQLISKERTEHVRLVIDGLPARDRRILRALFLEERERDEVCAEMGVGRDYLRVLVHRAKSLLRDRMLGPQAAPGTEKGRRPAPRALRS